MSNFPTSERTRKPDWEQAGKRRRRSDTLQALRSRVSDDVLVDARLWTERWELAINGYCDAQKNPGDPAIPGNLLTFNALRGKAWRPIKAFKVHAGAEKHLLLVQLLANGWSFASIGRARWPELSESRSRNKASQKCAEVLEELHEFWTEERRQKARTTIEIATLYKAGHNIPTLCQKYNLASPAIRHLIEKGEKMISRPKHSLTALGG